MNLLSIFSLFHYYYFSFYSNSSMNIQETKILSYLYFCNKPIVMMVITYKWIKDSSKSPPGFHYRDNNVWIRPILWRCWTNPPQFILSWTTGGCNVYLYSSSGLYNVQILADNLDIVAKLWLKFVTHNKSVLSLLCNICFSLLHSCTMD